MGSDLQVMDHHDLFSSRCRGLSAPRQQARKAAKIADDFLNAELDDDDCAKGWRVKKITAHQDAEAQRDTRFKAVRVATEARRPGASCPGPGRCGGPVFNGR
jgi:hypothetical protein